MKRVLPLAIALMIGCSQPNKPLKEGSEYVVAEFKQDTIPKPIPTSEDISRVLVPLYSMKLISEDAEDTLRNVSMIEYAEISNTLSRAIKYTRYTYPKNYDQKINDVIDSLNLHHKHGFDRIEVSFPKK